MWWFGLSVVGSMRRVQSAECRERWEVRSGNKKKIKKLVCDVMVGLEQEKFGKRRRKLPRPNLQGPLKLISSLSHSLLLRVFFHSFTSKFITSFHAKQRCPFHSKWPNAILEMSQTIECTATVPSSTILIIIKTSF